MKTNGLHLAVVALLATASILTAQPTVEWQVDYGGPGSSGEGRWASPAHDGTHLLIGLYYLDLSALFARIDDSGQIMNTINDENYLVPRFVEQDVGGGILFGAKDSLASEVYQFMKVLPSAGVVWEIQTPPGAFVQQIHSVSSGGYVAGGSVEVAPSDYDPWIGRYDENAEVLWTETVPLDGFNPAAREAEETADGDYIMVTYSQNEILLLEFNDQGEHQIIAGIPTLEMPSFTGIQITIDGGILLNGWFRFETDRVCPLVKLDADGTPQFRVSGEYIFSQEADATQLADGGYLVVLSTNQSESDSTLLYRFDAAGDLLWETRYEYEAGVFFETEGRNVYSTGDSTFVLAGAWRSYEPGNMEWNMFLTKFLLPPTDLEVEVESYREPLIVDPPDAFYWHGTLANNTDEPQTRDVWVVARGPDGSLSEPYAIWEGIAVPAQGTVEADIRQVVPQWAPPGEYNYIVRAGDYPTHRIQDHLALTVTGDAQPEIPDAAGGGTTVPWFEKPARVGDVQR